jgi:hypothetical protein
LFIVGDRRHGGIECRAGLRCSSSCFYDRRRHAGAISLEPDRCEQRQFRRMGFRYQRLPQRVVVAGRPRARHYYLYGGRRFRYRRSGLGAGRERRCLRPRPVHRRRYSGQRDELAGWRRAKGGISGSGRRRRAPKTRRGPFTQLLARWVAIGIHRQRACPIDGDCGRLRSHTGHRRSRARGFGQLLTRRQEAGIRQRPQATLAHWGLRFRGKKPRLAQPEPRSGQLAGILS